MRMARIKLKGRGAVYHCISRIVGGQCLLGDLEKEQLVGMLWQQAAFSGLEVITHAIMSNHIHVLVRTPGEVEVSDGELVERAVRYYGAGSLYAESLRRGMEQTGGLSEGQRAGLLVRMGDVSVFMKELKQRFSRWYNRRHDRFGTLWAERFKSLLVEDRPEVVQVVAAYVDLNPLRAKSVSDPKDYRWSGYGQAVAGHELARRGLASFHPMGGWELVGAAYRKVLLVKAGRARRLGQAVMGGESIDQELARGGCLGLAEVLRLRVRYFSDGVALGSRNYVEEVFREFRARFGPRRKTGARPLRGVGVLGHLATLRDLRVRGVG